MNKYVRVTNSFGHWCIDVLLIIINVLIKSDVTFNTSDTFSGEMESKKCHDIKFVMKIIYHGWLGQSCSDYN